MSRAEQLQSQPQATGHSWQRRNATQASQLQPNRTEHLPKYWVINNNSMTSRLFTSFTSLWKFCTLQGGNNDRRGRTHRGEGFSRACAGHAL